MRTYTVHVTTELQYRVTVSAQGAEEAQEKALDVIIGADNPDDYWAGEADYTAEVE